MVHAVQLRVEPCPLLVDLFEGQEEAALAALPTLELLLGGLEGGWNGITGVRQENGFAFRRPSRPSSP